MSETTTLLRGITEDHRSYNRHAATQAAGGAFALPLLRKEARERALDAGDGPIVIADYGSSQGKNSLKPMRAAIAVLAALGPAADLRRPHLRYFGTRSYEAAERADFERRIAS